MFSRLYFGTILDGRRFRRCMLWFCWLFVLILLQGLWDEVWNVCVKCSFVVVLLEFYSHVQSSFPVDSYIVVSFECLDKMVGICITLELDSEVIYNQCESCGPPHMSP